MYCIHRDTFFVTTFLSNWNSIRLCHFWIIFILFFAIQSLFSLYLFGWCLGILWPVMIVEVWCQFCWHFPDQSPGNYNSLFSLYVCSQPHIAITGWCFLYWTLFVIHCSLILLLHITFMLITLTLHHRMAVWCPGFGLFVALYGSCYCTQKPFIFFCVFNVFVLYNGVVNVYLF